MLLSQLGRVHGHGRLLVGLVEGQDRLLVKACAFGNIKLEFVDVAVLVADHVIVLRVDGERFDQRDHEWSQLLQQLVHGVLNEPVGSRLEVAALVKTLSAVPKHLERKYLDAQCQHWRNFLICELVALQ